MPESQSTSLLLVVNTTWPTLNVPAVGEVNSRRLRECLSMLGMEYRHCRRQHQSGRLHGWPWNGKLSWHHHCRRWSLGPAIGRVPGVAKHGCFEGRGLCPLPAFVCGVSSASSQSLQWELDQDLQTVQWVVLKQKRPILCRQEREDGCMSHNAIG